VWITRENARRFPPERKVAKLVNVLDHIAKLGSYTQDLLVALGVYTRFCLSTAKWVIRGPGIYARKQTLVQMYEVGTMSIPVAGVTGGFIGMVLVVEMFNQFSGVGLQSRIGVVTNISVLKQIGPVMTAVMLAGRVGGAMAAELGTMRVTEQIDAMRAMGSDPIRTLVVPRVLGCLIMMPAMTITSNLIGILGAYFVAVSMGVDSKDYIDNSISGLDMYTAYSGIIKAMFFGAAIATVSCYKGFYCGSGAQGVGKACTESFVVSFITILIMNFFLALILNTVYSMLWPVQNILM